MVVIANRLIQHASMQRSWLVSCLVICCLAILLAGCSPTSEKQASPNFDRLSACPRPGQVALTSIYAESLCGNIPVYEDRAAASGRKINLNVMVIPATGERREPDPIFFLAGGPGQAATEVGPMLFGRLDNLVKHRDIVLVDQRGTGKSNSLACDMGDDPFANATSPLDKVESVQMDKLKTCLGKLDANPALYTTPIAMDDLDEVRRTLGYEKINLYGISYGTRAALVYLRRHGDTVRSVILDSVAPLTMTIPARVAVDAQHAFDRLLADCAADTSCHTAFPELGEHFENLLATLRQNPARVTIKQPRTGENIDVLIEARTVTRLIRGILYDRTLSSLLPLALHEAWMGNFQPLVTLSYSITGEDAGMSIGMMASVLCSEDMRRSYSADSTHDFDNALYHSLKPICDFWPRGDIPADYFQPVKSDVPVLLASGKLDPITPPEYAIDAAKTLSNSAEVIVPGVGHGATFHGCMPEVMEKFLDTLAPGKLDTTCVGSLRRPPFFTSFAGTAPPAESAGTSPDDSHD